VQQVQADPARAAPLLFAYTLGRLEEDDLQLGSFSARLVLLHLPACMAAFELDADSSRRLLELCLAAVVAAPQAV